MTQEALIEKIRKLQAKANDKSVTEAEAALYAQKVAELLQQHNLSEASLEVKEEQQEVTEEGISNSSTVNPWAQQMAWAAAQLYFCDIYLKRSWEGKIKIVFVGRPHNIEVAKSMTEYLIKTISRLANEYARSPAAVQDWNYTFTRARNGFHRGAGERMAERLRALHREQTAAKVQRSSSGNPANLPALYQDEAKAVEEYQKRMHPNLRTGNGRGSDISGNHAAHGRNAANSISLNSQVGGNSTRMIGGR